MAGIEIFGHVEGGGSGGSGGGSGGGGSGGHPCWHNG